MLLLASHLCFAPTRYIAHISINTVRQRTLMSSSPSPSSSSSSPSSSVPTSDGEVKQPNVQFYRNMIPSQPSGDLIDVIHTKWCNDMDLLEDHHGYIQWLFPLFESGGMNRLSSPLTKEEARIMREDREIAGRILLSYKMMLGFYGFVLDDEATGKISRGPNWKDRLRNFNRNSHNFLRISRILTSLSHLGFARYKRPFLMQLEVEVLSAGTLKNAQHSLVQFWRPLLDEGSPLYEAKTGETKADRVDSIFFTPGGARRSARIAGRDPGS
eukprot:TRINITY_DN9257_c0_g4_i4.p1 TRINITY_DN9257_c0_g4~~TRINITY_DN9257_c0_g4_i4.p1  ORF type:complete len:270 (+),score=49.60 TRINITY_DN9257_c0_g4_i4:110-919(+)